MPGRKYSAGNGYRYGFNGKEMDDETSGVGNEYDYGARVYNPRIGKFLSVDPMSGTFPYFSPYQFSGNTPIQAIDLDGLEPIDYKWSNPYVPSHPGSGVNRIPSYLDNLAFQDRMDDYYGILTAYAIQDVDKKLYVIFEDAHGTRQWAREYDEKGWKGDVNEFKWNTPPDASRALTYMTVGPLVGLPALVALGELLLDAWASKIIADAAEDQKVSNEKPGVDNDPIKPQYDYGKYGSDFKDHADEIRDDLGIPKDWEAKASDKDQGVRFIDPENPKGNNVRVMPGRVGSQTEKPYVVQYKNGTPVDVDGNPVRSTTGTGQNEAKEIHVPLKDYKFN